MADFVVHYHSVTGHVLAMFPRSTSDNISTCEADGYLEVDGVKVIDGIGPNYSSDLSLAVVTDPTATDEPIIPGVFEVDDTTTPTDVDFRTDSGRNPDYDFIES